MICSFLFRYQFIFHFDDQEWLLRPFHFYATISMRIIGFDCGSFVFSFNCFRICVVRFWREKLKKSRPVIRSSPWRRNQTRPEHGKYSGILGQFTYLWVTFLMTFGFLLFFECNFTGLLEILDTLPPECVSSLYKFVAQCFPPISPTAPTANFIDEREGISRLGRKSHISVDWKYALPFTEIKEPPQKRKYNNIFRRK